MTETAVTVGEGGKKRHWWRFVFVFIAVVVVALALGGGTRWTLQYQAHKKATQPDAITKKTQNVQDIALSGDFNRAHSEIDESLKNPELSVDAKQKLLFYKGLTFENEKKYDEAIAAYKQADTVKVTQEAAEALARTATSKGDKALAIEYYKKALQRIAADDPLAEANKQLYELSIKELSGE